ncbi:H-2 class II histocompatibility antigen, A-U alpha chain-like [Syngnathoides biaculeatus]|uniref:H-2 class II histocompatibility antigen, A-U alpha chain-like n=1 Tax=Syngnathoides biaculeatus TaxID=300417 RepID=UPI002ADDD5B2|nr:H-2 class II histocompatibility antigen, A-U alpha chain-like [Syngnathoides biaculeatus]
MTRVILCTGIGPGSAGAIERLPFGDRRSGNLQSDEMKALYFLVLFLGSSAAEIYCQDYHTDISVIGCSDTDAEVFNALDGEDVWYADFSAKRIVEPQPNFVEHMSVEKGTYQVAESAVVTCRVNLNVTRRALSDQPRRYDRPAHPVVYPRDEELAGEKNTLVCHVSGFYPAPVKVRWAKNGGDAAAPGRGSCAPYPDDDGTFHQTFRLDYVPAQGDIYSCVVEHPALEQPRSGSWEVNVKRTGPGPTIFCALGLTAGLVGVAAGTFFLIKGNNCS